MNYHECFTYNSDTGELVWKVRPGSHFNTVAGCNVTNARCAGKVAGTKCQNGYMQVWVNGSIVKVHRIIYEMHFGPIPDGIYIDHENLDRSDNRIENLRKATPSENKMNSPIQSNNTTGFKGVSYCQNTSKWKAAIKTRGVITNLGSFMSPELAHMAYCEAAKLHHGDFARTS